MTLTDAELAAVGRLMWPMIPNNQARIEQYEWGMRVPQAWDGVSGEIFGWDQRPIEYVAADVLSKLVAEGLCPSVHGFNSHPCGCGVLGTGNTKQIEVTADTWPLAVLRAASAYQTAKDSK